MRVVVHEEGQRGQVEQVRDPQVQHEDAHAASAAPASTHAPQTAYVGHRPHYEHAHEDARQQRVREAQVGALTVGAVYRHADIPSVEMWPNKS